MMAALIGGVAAANAATLVIVHLVFLSRAYGSSFAGTNKKDLCEQERPFSLTTIDERDLKMLMIPMA